MIPGTNPFDIKKTDTIDSDTKENPNARIGMVRNGINKIDRKLEKVGDKLDNAGDNIKSRVGNLFGNDDSDSNVEIELDEKDQELSYSRLLNFIAENHPVDPETKQNFMVWERIVIKDFW